MGSEINLLGTELYGVCVVYWHSMQAHRRLYIIGYNTLSTAKHGYSDKYRTSVYMYFITCVGMPL